MGLRGLCIALALYLAVAGCAAEPLKTVPAAATKAALSVDITTHLGDEQEFRQGDEISLLVSVSQPAWLLILYQDATGKVIQILPNARAGQHQYPAGSYFPIPDAKQPFLYRVAPPFGREYAWVIASASPLPEQPGRQLPNGLRLLKLPPVENAAALQKLLHLDADSAVIARVAINTRP